MTDTFAKSAEVFAQDVGNELVILDLKAGVYFGLDAIGSRIWNLLVGGMPLPTITERLLEEFDVRQQVLERDLASLVDDLVRSGLLVPSPDNRCAA